MKTANLSPIFPLVIFLILFKAIQAFLAKILCHIQISAATVAVFALEIRTFSTNFGSTLTAHRIDIMLLNLQNDDAFLPCLVFQFFSDGRNQTKWGIFSDACQNDISIVFVVFRKDQNTGILFFAVINDLSADLMCIMLMQIFQFFPVSVICLGIAAATLNVFGSFDPVVNLPDGIRVLSAPFYIEGTLSFSGRIENAANCACVLTGKDRGTDFIFCCNSFTGTTPVCHWYFPWDMKFCVVFLQNQCR